MARINGSGFKMKSSPAKGLSNFFSGLGRKGTEERQKKQVQENQGMTDFEKRRAEKKSRKAGESKFQADVRKRKETSKTKRADVKSDYEFFKGHRDAGTTPGTPRAKETLKVVETPEVVEGESKIDWTKAPKVGTTARTKWYKKFNLALDDTTPPPTPVPKKSPYKKGLGKYAKKAKGSRGYKMKK
jgi:hypothetical protein